MSERTRTIATPDEPIAVIGMACRLPQADGPAAFWRLLRDGVEAVGETPAERWDPAALSTRGGSRADESALAHGAFLDHVDRFDAAFFGIGPAEAAVMDPQQRLVLELAWEALEDARITPDRLAGTDAGVFIGAIWDDWSRLLHGHGPATAGQYGLTGTHRGIIANRVSYVLGLRGPSLTLDSAQSSSLVAVHSACASLRSGESTVALVGGVNLNLLPESAAALGRLGALSADGHVRLLDADASGTVRGEGGALVVLKPLRTAQADGDRIVCVIRGSAVNNDGATHGLTTPSADAQRAVIRTACRRSGVDPADVQYVELHGTGTPVGDPIEARAVGTAAGTGHVDEPLRVGSVKTNLGHLEAAAGIVGLLKVALSIRHRELPPSLNHHRPHPEAHLDAHHLRVQTTHGPWPRPDRELVAGVNSWGIGGTNCHVLLSEPPATPATPVVSAASASAPAARPADHLPLVWPVSARTAPALRAQAERLHTHLTETDPVATVDQVGHALAVTRTAFLRRAAAVGTTRAELLDGLRALTDGTASAHLVTATAPAGPARLAVLFGGGGSQRPQMGAGLYAAHPAYATAFDAVCDELDRHLPRPIRPLIFATPGTEDAALLDRTDFALPALMAVEIALYRLYESWGLRPTHLTGHSMGELAAAHIAGVLTLPDVCELAVARARLIQSAAGGAMAAVQASEDEVLAELGAYAAVVSVAAINAPDSTVISGDTDAILALCEQWRSRDRKTKRIAVTVAGHSPHMDGILDEFRTVARRLSYSAPQIPVVSNVTGTVAADAELTDPEYWVQHVRATVRFAEGIRTLHAQGVTTYLELSASSVLAPAVGTCLDGEDTRPAVITTLQPDRPDTLAAATALAALFTTGHDLAWAAICEPGAASMSGCDLPTYPFQRRSHWPKFDSVQLPGSVFRPASENADAEADAEPEHLLAGLDGDALRAAVREFVDAAATAVLGERDDADGPAGVSGSTEQTFKEQGFTSLGAVEMRNRLETATGLRLPSGLLFDYPTVETLVSYLCRTLTGQTDPAEQATNGAVVVDEPLAIVGMACRFPGGVQGPEDLWRLVAEGGEVVSGFPVDRGWDLEGLFDPDPDHAGTSYAREGGFLHDAAGFDAEFFGISPREALAMDPQQRLLLEAAWEALEHARIDPRTLHGSRTGVFTGVMNNDYGSGAGLGGSTTEGIDGYLLTGRSNSVASGRLSYVFGFEGPAVSVDTACSSSLVALHLAGQALRLGECDVALAGGVTVMSTPSTFVEFSRQRGLSSDGRCRAFSADAEGTGWSEGVGLLVVERLSDALALGHRVWGVVRGSAVNQDGASNGLTAPNGPSQRRVIRQAWASAGVGGGGVDVVEAHGTGTRLGDPIEAQALLDTYGVERGSRGPLWLGSLKSNIGHAQAAAGVGGVIKMVMAMERGVLPRTLHVGVPTEHVDWSGGSVRLLTEAVPWPVAADGRPRRAAVSSFGISGTNAHVILEQAPAGQAVGSASAAGSGVCEGGSVVWSVSGVSERGLRDQAGRLAAFLRGCEGLDHYSVGHALVTGRAVFDYRAVVVGGSVGELLVGLEGVAAGEPGGGVLVGRAGVGVGELAVVFAGQGSQRVGMGRELYGLSPVFAGVFDEVCAAFDPLLEVSLRDVILGADAGEEVLAQTCYAQPAIFAVEVALYRLLESLDVRPGFVAGHSIGELVAAYVAGVWSLPDAVRLVAARARLMQTAPAGGAMMSIRAAEADVRTSLETLGVADAVAIAAVNGPRQCVVSGDVDQVRRVADHWRAQGHRATELRVSHAFHSGHMDGVLAEFREVAATVRCEPARIPVVSAVTGRVATAEELADPDYWTGQIRRTVRFSDAIRHLRQSGVTTFLEVSGHPAITQQIEETLDTSQKSQGPDASPKPHDPANRPGAVVASVTADPQRMLSALARAHVTGTQITWPAWFTHTPTTTIDLPTYAFDHQHYWLAPPSAGGDAGRLGLTGTADHPLLGALVTPAEGDGFLLSGLLSLRTQPWLADHVIAGTTLFPGTAFLELAFQACRAAGCDEVAELTLEQPLVLPAQESFQIQVVVREPDEHGRRALAVHSRPQEPDGAHDRPWTCHATGAISSAAVQPAVSSEWLPADAVPLDLDDAYARLADHGYAYGPAFQGLRAAWSAGSDRYAEVEIAEEQRADAARVGLHPALLDAVLHVLALDGVHDGRTQVPFSFTGVRLHADGATTLRARLRRTDDTVAITLTDLTGEVVADLSSLALRSFDSRTAAAGPPLHAVHWVPAETQDAAEGTAPEPIVLHVTGTGPQPMQDVHRETARVLAAVRSHVLGGSGSGSDDGASSGSASGAGVLVVVTSSGDVAGAAVGGLVRSAQAEYPGRIVLVENDAESGAESGVHADAVEAAVACGEPFVRLRGGVLLVPRLVRALEAGPGSAVGAESGAGAGSVVGSVFGPEGAVLVSGGSGTLGRLVVRHLVERYGVRDVVLLSRAGRVPEELADLTGHGVRLRAAACDVGDRESLAGVVAGLAGELRGVVHAAGVLDDVTLAGLTPERVGAVLRPKADGAWHLHELTRDLPLTAFVMFSSVAGVMGTAGQGNYAAANAFLDQLARNRRDEGLPAQSLAWGLWAESSGMTGQLEAADRARLARSGIAPLPTSDALALFDTALASAEPALVTVALDQSALRTAATEGQLSPLLSALVRVRPRRAGSGSGSGAGFAEQIQSLSPGERRRVLVGVVRRHVAAVLGRSDADGVPVERAFSELGFDSLMGMDLRNRLSTATGRQLPASLVFDQPTVRDLSDYLLTQLVGTTEQAAHTTTVTSTAVDEPLAIVGMACRFPGGVHNPEDLWHLVAGGRDAISGFPDNRGWDLEALFHPDPDHTGTSYAREGGFLHEAADFDAEFFGISPREAMAMDPQQRLLLETAWEALEHARIDPRTLHGSRTGVFTGVMYNDYAARLRPAPPEFEGLLAAGNTGSVISGRLSYVFGFEGPAVSVDTACSSSLVALHLAGQALRLGECDVALAGGVTVMSTPSTFVEFSRQRGLSSDGRCRAFSSDAEGTGWSEGVGLLVVERLSDALALGHRVWGVVRGSAVNQDGASNGLTAPNGPSQQRVIRQAWVSAGVGGGGVDVVEAHGTGTRLGDPIEAQALLDTYGVERGSQGPLWLGSLKSNIGHAQAAAGVGGVIKMVMAMERGVLPRTLHVGVPTEHVDWSGGSVRLLTEAVPWPVAADGRPRRAAVSSFGISGTNAHVILEQAPQQPEPDTEARTEPEPEPEASPATAPAIVPVVLSAHGPQALAHLADRVHAHMAKAPDTDLYSLAHALTTTRATHDHRAVILTRDHHTLLASLQALQGGEPDPATTVTGTASGATGTVFVFPGQGSQWAGMALELLESSDAFRERMHECAVALAEFTDWSLLDVLKGTPGAPDLDRVDVVQPVLFAVMVSLAALWESYGVRPDAVAGHSQGEIAAACVAGALTLSDAARVVALRSQALAELAGTGGMVSVLLPLDQVEKRIERWGERLTVAAVNSPSSVVVSGDPQALDELQADCTAAGLRTRRVPVDYASHSPHVEAIRDRLAELLAPVSPRPSSIPFFSAVTAEERDTTGLDGTYWYQNLRQPVRFDQVTRTLLDRGHQVFIEVSAHPVLTVALDETFADTDTSQASSFGTLRRDDGGLGRFLTSMAEGYTHGLDVSWSTAFAEPPRQALNLPTYPFQHESYWLEPVAQGANVTATGLTSADHPLLGALVTSAEEDRLLLSGRLSLRTHPWLADHALAGTPLLPGTAFLELALKAAQSADCSTVDDLTILAPLRLAESDGRHVQVEVGPQDSDGRRALTIHSRPADEDTVWTKHAVGHLSADISDISDTKELLAAWPPPGAKTLDHQDAYDRLAAQGYDYGPAFQGLRGLWRRGDEVYAEVELDETEAAEAARFRCHPALLDAALHPLALGALGEHTAGAVPFEFGAVSVHTAGPDRLRVRLEREAAGQVALTATDSQGAPVVSVRSIALRPLDTRSLLTPGGLLHRVVWEPVLGGVVAGVGSASDVVVLRVPAVGVVDPGVAVRAALSVVLERVRGHVLEGSGSVAASGAGAGSGVLVVVTSSGDLVGAAVGGLVRSVQAEYPGRIVLVETDAETDGGSGAEAGADADVVGAAVACGEPFVRLRGGVVLVPRLVRVVESESGSVSGSVPGSVVGSGAVFGPDGVVLVSGGSGTLGRLVVRHLVERYGVRDVVLLSRGGGVPEGLADLTGRGVRLRGVACDVGDREALAGVVAGLGGELRGVVHAAGVLDDVTLAGLTLERVGAVLRPKADGAWYLHELTRDLPLTAFVMFSSLAGVMGTAGQGNYAAANAFLDELARVRHAEGLPAQSLAWGLWAQSSGMTGQLEAADRARLTRAGIAPLSTADGLALLDTALSSAEPALVTAALDQSALRTAATEGHLSPLLSSLVKVRSRRTGTGAGGGSGSGFAEQVRGVEPGERRRVLVGVVRRHVAAVLGRGDADEVPVERAFSELGFDSLMGVDLRNRLSTAVGRQLPASLVFDQPTIRDLSDYLLTQLIGTTEPTASTTTVNPIAVDEPLAIVGMACRFPGGVQGPEDLWRLVAEGGEVVSGFPVDRGWDLEGLFDPDPDHAGTSYAREGGFLHDAAGFDAEFFGISPREALAMDPQQRLLLEAAWEALEHARIDPRTLHGSRTGVFTGVMYNDYATRVTRPPAGLEGYLANGSASSVASGRLSYVFGFEGPAVSVDTACSSSLVALHLAGQALRLGECDVALAGGVTVMSTPSTFVEFSRQRGLSPDGRCRAFSADADGTGFSEGVGLLVVERLSDALALGHRVWGVVRGSAVNQDGASNGLTAPNGPSQQRVIRQAWASAGVGGGGVDVVEAHGTGTRLGDPIEAQALLDTYGVERGGQGPLWLGSLKSNIGHAQAAAGVGGVIKMVMAMEHGTLPRTLHAGEPTPHVDWSSGAVRLLTESAPWPASEDRPRRAAVSSFGISGTNAHVILEQGPTGPAGRAVAGQAVGSASAAGSGVCEGGSVVWSVSGVSERGLRDQAGKLAAFLRGCEGLDHYSVGHALVTGRAVFDYRAVVVGGSVGELLAGLEGVAAGEPGGGVLVGRAGVGVGELAVVFAGQGSQRVGMGRELYGLSPVFAGVFDEVCAAFDPLLGLSLRDVILGADAGEEVLAQTCYAQPAIFAVEVALYRLLESLDVRPGFVAGHSIGELVAAYVAGVWSLPDAVRLVAARARLMQTAPAGGAMMSIRAAEADVRTSLETLGVADAVAIAAVNGPRQCVVSGDVDQVRRVADHWRAQGHRATELRVSHAFHSGHMDGVLAEFREVAATVRCEPARIPVVSAVTGRVATAEELADPDYWTGQIRRTVRFSDAIRHLRQSGVTTFLEVSGHPAMVQPMEETLTDLDDSAKQPDTGNGKGNGNGTVVASATADPQRMLSALARAHVTGTQITWPAWFTHSPTTAIDLPTYAFNHHHYWLDGDRTPEVSGAGVQASSHPLIGNVLEIAGNLGTVYSGQLSLRTHPYFADPSTGTAQLPGTALLELALHIGQLEGVPQLDGLALERPILLPSRGTVDIQVVLTGPDSSGLRALSVHARPDGESWTLHASGLLAPRTGTVLSESPAHTSDAEFLAEVTVPDGAGFAFHPGFLETALRPLLPKAAQPDTVYLPTSWRDALLHAPASRTAGNLRVWLSPTGPDTYSLSVTDASDALVATVDAMGITAVPTTDLSPGGLLHRVVWEPVLGGVVAGVGSASDVVVLRVPAVGVVDPGVAVRAALSVVLERVRGHVLEGSGSVAASGAGAGSGVLVVVTSSGDLVGAAVGGLVRSVQAEYPGRIVLVETDAETDGGSGAEAGADADVVGAAVACGEPFVRLRGGVVLVPRLVRVVESESGSVSGSVPGSVVGSGAVFGPDGVVLVSGGSGTLGRLVVRHLVERYGVRDVVLLSRGGGVPEGLADLTGRGVRLRGVACDVGDREALAGVVAGLGGELRGVVHAAGVLDDVTLAGLTLERVGAVLRPKADGAWYLHELTRDLPLTAFVMFSSLAGVMGTAGQGNYAAANAFLDELARVRHAEGLPAQSLAWGLWAQSSGMTEQLAAADRARLARTGIAPLSSADGLALLDTALASAEPALVTAALDQSALHTAATEGHLPPLLSALVRNAEAQPDPTVPISLQGQLADLGEPERARLVLDVIHGEVAAVLGYDTVAEVDIDAELMDIGFDSLIAVELTNRLNALTGLRLSSTLVFDYPTTVELAEYIHAELAA